MKGSSFKAHVSGDISLQMDGSAAFDRRPNVEDGQWIFLIVLTHRSNRGDGQHQITFSNRLTTPVETRRYNLGQMGSDTFTGIYDFTMDDDCSGMYTADQGNLTIELSTPSRIVGRFSFTGSGISNLEVWARDGTVSVVGDFDATINPNAHFVAFGKEDR